MEIFTDYSLKDKNTFGIDINTRFFAAPKSFEDIVKIIHSEQFDSKNFFILGAGSNVLFKENYTGFIIHPSILGLGVVSENENSVLVKANAGEDWDSFVQWTVLMGYGGLENLSLIPGTVGAAPVQNIGAYGVEAGDLIEKLDAFEIESGKVQEFEHDDCDFAYRNSVFKSSLKNKYIILSVYFRLSKKPVFKTHYGAVNEELNRIGNVSLRSVRQAVINIRESKLPKPENCPNAGSFFKNPVVQSSQAEELMRKFPGIVMYKGEANEFKIAAGWMIDHLGWKGKTFGNAAVHDKQALVLVNKGNASGNEILELAERIRKSVLAAFNVKLEFEVNVI